VGEPRTVSVLTVVTPCGTALKPCALAFSIAAAHSQSHWLFCTIFGADVQAEVNSVINNIVISRVVPLFSVNVNDFAGTPTCPAFKQHSSSLNPACPSFFIANSRFKFQFMIAIICFVQYNISCHAVIILYFSINVTSFGLFSLLEFQRFFPSPTQIVSPTPNCGFAEIQFPAPIVYAHLSFAHFDPNGVAAILVIVTLTGPT
jgi:hypothetical protein